MWIVEPKLAYRYSVDGEDYLGHDIAATAINTSSEADAQKKIAPYPVGMEVSVHYNPSKPHDAVLETRCTVAPFAVFGLLAVFLFTVGVLALLGIIHL